MSPAAVFLDRDGTIIEQRAYLSDPADVVLERGAVQGLRMMTARGYALVVISNQSGIARGYFSAEDDAAVNRRIAELLAPEGVHILAWYVCPHGPKTGCNCRKPAPGMVNQAIREYGLDLPNSFVIGDKRIDIEVAVAVSCTGILVMTGYGKENVDWARKHGHAVCRDLVEANEIMGTYGC